MARANQQDPAKPKHNPAPSTQADETKIGTNGQRQAGDDPYPQTQQGGSDTVTRFNDWASI